MLELFFFFLSAFLILHPSSFEEGAGLLRFMRGGSLSFLFSLSLCLSLGSTIARFQVKRLALPCNA